MNKKILERLSPMEQLFYQALQKVEASERDKNEQQKTDFRA